MIMAAYADGSPTGSKTQGQAIALKKNTAAKQRKNPKSTKTSSQQERDAAGF